MFIVANWKAYVEDLDRAKRLFAISKKVGRASGCDIVLAPPAPFLGALAVKNVSGVAFAAQDVSSTSGGALTGEVTAATYRAAGATYALIGHSERRAAGDTDVVVAKKLTHALAHDLAPILCVGERERDSDGRYLGYVREEIAIALATLTPKECASVMVAYEPLWAIGKTANHAIGPNDLAEMVLYIRKVLAEFLPGKSSGRTCVLYGGAVEPENIRDLASASQVDGFLIGHASVDDHTFTELLRQLS